MKWKVGCFKDNYKVSQQKSIYLQKTKWKLKKSTMSEQVLQNRGHFNRIEVRFTKI